MLHAGLRPNVFLSARLPGKDAVQGCRARLPGKAAGQGCRARLPGKAAGQGFRARLPGKAVGQGGPRRTTKQNLDPSCTYLRTNAGKKRISQFLSNSFA
jgi:hypothetical protein